MAPTEITEAATINATESKWCSIPNQGAAETITSTENTSRRRRVHFQEESDTQETATQRELTPDMIQELWYSYEEIDTVKKQLRSILCPHRRSCLEARCGEQDVASCLDAIENSILERYGPQRTDYKRKTLRCILKAQKKSRNPNFLRHVSHQCTAWARALAANQGLEDYCDVYDPLGSLLDSTVDLAYPLGVNSPRKKRDHDDEQDESRSKRRRLSVAS